MSHVKDALLRGFSSLAIARTAEASNPPIGPYSSQRTHTGNNRPLLHAWTTLELTAGPTATRTGLAYLYELVPNYYAIAANQSTQAYPEG